MGTSEPVSSRPCPKTAIKMQMSALYLARGKGHRLLTMNGRMANSCFLGLLCPHMATGLNAGDGELADRLFLSRYTLYRLPAFCPGRLSAARRLPFTLLEKGRVKRSCFFFLPLPRPERRSCQLSGFPHSPPGHGDFPNQKGPFGALQSGSIRDPLSS